METPEAIHVLVAEDDEELLDLIRRVLSEEGYRVICAGDGTAAMSILEDGEFDLVLTDIRMPGPDGMAVLRQAISRRLHQPVILMTAFGSIESAVQAMREGAYHYLTKPFDIEDLVEVVGGAARHVRCAGDLPADDGRPHLPIIFRSRVMSELLAMARDVAGSTATVLVAGSSGTGKELLARAIHRLSARRTESFVAVDCNAIPETLLESELFGHRRGAFSGAVSDKAGIIEQAEGGTLFLDEVGNLSPPVQAKLLRFLQERSFRRVGDPSERPVNVRLVSASNQDLQALVQKGAFRDDLYYRLSVIHLKIPDLKDRREDITPLVYHFIRKFNASYQVEGIRPDALDLLVDFQWPGNVRQLENVIERAVILRKAGLIQPRDLPDEIMGGHAAGEAGGRSLEETERRYIQQLLEECGGNQSRVARILGINRRTLYRKLRKTGGDG
ncbi:MAG: sigma-54-dependent Fis family transcriptional regulator [Deltaproteobacteria bacterium]|nr:sigma-54-dependent Fis family transcriptional regulator [Deltaproteobacteria bacterium]